MPGYFNTDPQRRLDRYGLPGGCEGQILNLFPNPGPPPKLQFTLWPRRPGPWLSVLKSDGVEAPPGKMAQGFKSQL
eukprot:3774385-Rhodomonas_salina.2